jgi:large subunit ribosomal protein L9
VKVTLLSDIPKIGKKGEEKEVSDGYGRNYLLRHKLAVLAGSEVSIKIKNQLRASLMQKEKQKREEIKFVARIESTQFEVAHSANQQGHLFAAVSPQEIAKSLQKALHISVDPDKIEIREPIKTIGEHKVFYKTGNKFSEFRLNVKSI